jgi:anti-anti-sigma factor
MGANGWVDVEVTGDQCWRVALTGEFDSVECRELHRVLDDLLCVDGAVVDLAMEDVAFFGSAGVAAIIGAVTDNTMAGSHLTIVSASTAARRVIELTEMHRLIEVRDSR